MTEVTEKKKVKQKIKPPKNYFVVFKNDDYTPTEFVVYLLRSIFHKTESEAEKIMMNQKVLFMITLIFWNMVMKMVLNLYIHI